MSALTNAQVEVPQHINIGGRKSKLAVVQTENIRDQILGSVPEIKTCGVSHLQTLGDQVQSKPLYSFGGKALWTTELEDRLRTKELDLVVHCLKDMPTTLPDEFELGGISAREDPTDAVCMAAGSPYKTLDELPAGSVVGTSSVRRSAQLKKHYPGLVFESVRGNLQTRLRKLDDPETNFKCIILATAGLVRLHMEERITYKLSSPVMYYAVGQGALGFEIRKGDLKMKKVCEAISDRNATICGLAERSVMRSLEGGCSVPIGVESLFNFETSILEMTGVVISVDGQQYVKETISYKINDDQVDSIACGKKLAAQLVARGAKQILDEVHLEKLAQ